MDVKTPNSDQEARIPTTLLMCINKRIGMKFGRRCRPAPDAAARRSPTCWSAVFTERALGEQVAVEGFYCFGQCEHGPNVRFYPGGTWFREVAKDDVGTILDTLEAALAETK